MTLNSLLSGDTLYQVQCNGTGKPLLSPFFIVALAIRTSECKGPPTNLKSKEFSSNKFYFIKNKAFTLAGMDVAKLLWSSASCLVTCAKSSSIMKSCSVY